MSTDDLTVSQINAINTAARVNAEGWVDGFSCPIDDHVAEQSAILADGNGLDSIHADELAERLGKRLTRKMEERVWPHYSAALVRTVRELLSART